MAEYSFIEEFGPAINDDEEDPSQEYSFVAEFGPAEGGDPEPVQEEIPTEENPTWEDYGRQIMSGGAQIGGGVGWLLEKMGADEVGGAIRDRSMRSAEQWMKDKLDAVGLDQEGLSPQAKQAMQAEFLGEGTGADKWNKAKLMTASSLLGTLAGLGVGTIFTKGLAAAGMVKATGEASKLAATIGYGAGEAAVAAPSAGVATEEEVLAMSHEQLMDSPEYVATLEGLDMPEAEAQEKAKDLLAKAAGEETAALAMVSTFVLSAPFGNKLDEVLSGVVGAAKGRIGAGLQGAATEATQEFLQSGAEQLSANIALQDAQPDRSYGKDVLESAVGGAAAGGMMGGTMGAGVGPKAAPQDDGDNALNEIERMQQEAEARAREEGADPLDAAIAGARAASEVGSQVQGIFQEAAERQLSEQEYAELAETPAADRTPVRKIAREKLIPEDEFARAEEADAAAREEAQAEAAKTYERQQRAAAAVPAEVQREKQKEAEVQEAEYQRELQKGEEPQDPVNPLMAQRLEKAQQKEAAKQAAKEKVEERRAAAKAKAETEIEAVKQSATKALPDLSPDVVVGKDGQAVTREQMAEERAKTQVDAAAGETPLRPSEIKLERRVGNVKIALETPEGVERTGKREDGSTWRTKMKGVDYGFVRGSTGAEGDQVDAFVNTQEDSNYDTVFVIDQVNQNTGEFDEHKVMVGFKNQAAAVKAYKQQYDKGWKVGPVTQMGQKKFESWVKTGKKDAPIGNLPKVTQTVSPADIEAIQERQERKGRKKPKVMYRAGQKEYPVAPRGEWYGEADYEARGGSITEMTPDEFLATAAPMEIDEVARENIDDLKEMMVSGRTLDPLTLYKDKGTARDSDGRHRAIAAKELGIESVPVVDFRASPQRKGRKKPEVKYRLPDGHSILMSEEEEIPGFPGTEITVEIADAEGNVVGGITAEVNDETKELKIAISKVDESIRGQGAGLEMYNTLLQEAFRRGYKLTSDFSVSADAQRVYQALERRGAKVTRNPKATQNELGAWLSDDTRNPVFTVEPIDIRLRVEDLEGGRQFTVMDAQSGEQLGTVTAMDAATANDIGSRRFNTKVAVVENTEGDSLEDIIATAEGVMAAMPGLKGKVILDPLELPAELYEQMREDGQLGAKGMFHVETGDIYIFAANHSDVVDVVRTILHEGVAHKGLRVVLADKLPGLLQDIWQNGDQAAIQKIADKYGYDTGNATDRMKATEEYVAHLAERTPEAPILRRITDAIRQFLRRIGFLNEWTDSDIHALLRDVKRELQGKPLNKITFTEDVTIEETGEVVQIEERADVMLRQIDKRMSVIEKLKGCLAA